MLRVSSVGRPQWVPSGLEVACLGQAAYAHVAIGASGIVQRVELSLQAK